MTPKRNAAPRLAVVSEIPRLLSMGAEFHKAGNIKAPYEPPVVARMLEGLILGDGGAVIVTDGGMIGGALAQTYCSQSWLMAIEMFWWARDRSGLKLLSAFEEWARTKGANEVRMTSLASLPEANKILERRGYGACEISYSKVI